LPLPFDVIALWWRVSVRACVLKPVEKPVPDARPEHKIRKDETPSDDAMLSPALNEALVFCTLSILNFSESLSWVSTSTRPVRRRLLGSSLSFSVYTPYCARIEKTCSVVTCCCLIVFPVVTCNLSPVRSGGAPKLEYTVTVLLFLLDYIQLTILYLGGITTIIVICNYYYIYLTYIIHT